MTDDIGFVVCAHPDCDNRGEFVMMNMEPVLYCQDHASVVFVGEDTSAAASGCAIVLALVGAGVMAAVGLIV
jgi:hypothetical protein